MGRVLTRAIHNRSVALLGALCVALSIAIVTGQGTRSEPTVLTATIEAIDKANRSVTLKNPQGVSFDLRVPDQMQGFNSLKVGDQVTATYWKATALKLRKAGDTTPPAGPSTMTQRQDRKPGSETRREQTVTATVQAVDATARSITVKGANDHVIPIDVGDAGLLQNLKPGDSVDVTYYESLLVKIERPKK